MKKALVAGPCVSELGWELMAWQGHVRYLALTEGDEYDVILVSSSPSRKTLYDDFANEFRGHQVEGVRDCHSMKKIYNPMQMLMAENDLDDIADELRSNDYMVRRVRPSGWNLYKGEQTFVPYGVAKWAEDRKRKYDVVIHARNRSDKTEFTGTNYPLEKWNLIVGELLKRNRRACCIGTKEQSYAASCAKDLRDIPLAEVMDVIAAAGVVVGPSSGPMHLAALCKTPHVVWSHTRKAPSMGCNNQVRYEKVWNPFKTPVTFIPSITPSPQEIVDAVEAQLRK